MADNTVLKMTFKGPGEKDVLISLPHADETKTDKVKPLMEGIITNKDIFEFEPQALKKAQFVKTETHITPVDLS